MKKNEVLERIVEEDRSAVCVADRSGNIIAGNSRFDELYPGVIGEYAEAAAKEKKHKGPVFLSGKMCELKNAMDRVSGCDAPVLITGESGSGKAIFARYMHDHSSRRDGPFFSLQSALCGDLPVRETFLALDGGTILMEDVDRMSLADQERLLYMLETGTNLTAEAHGRHTVDVRVMATSSEDLSKLVREKKFLDQLYYRIRAVEFTVPPLRERREDIPTIIGQFRIEFNEKYRRDRRFSDDAMAALVGYDWPGNISEARNVVENMIITAADDEIARDDLPSAIAYPESGGVELPESLDSAIDELVGSVIRAASEKYGSSYKVAEALGISQTKASRLMRKYRWD